MIPPMQEESRAKFQDIYNTQKDGQVMSGAKAKSLFEQSGLDNFTLLQVWNLADLNKTGSLNADEFSIAMHLIVFKKKNPELVLPSTLPGHLLPAQPQQGFIPQFSGFPQQQQQGGHFNTSPPASHVPFTGGSVPQQQPQHPSPPASQVPLTGGYTGQPPPHPSPPVSHGSFTGGFPKQQQPAQQLPSHGSFKGLERNPSFTLSPQAQMPSFDPDDSGGRRTSMDTMSSSHGRSPNAPFQPSPALSLSTPPALGLGGSIGAPALNLNASLNASVSSIPGIDSEITKHEDKLRAALAEVRATLSQEQDALEKGLLGIEDRRARLREAEEEEERLKALQEKHEQTRAVTKDFIQRLEQLIAESAGRGGKRASDVKRIEDEIAELRKEQEGVSTMAKHSMSLAEEAENELSRLQEELRTVNSALHEGIRHVSDLESSVAHLTNLKASLESEGLQLDARLSHVFASAEQLQASKSTLEASVQELEKKLEEGNSKVAANRGGQNSLQSEVISLTTKQSELTRELHSVERQLQEMQENTITECSADDVAKFKQLVQEGQESLKAIERFREEMGKHKEIDTQAQELLKRTGSGTLFPQMGAAQAADAKKAPAAQQDGAPLFGDNSMFQNSDNHKTAAEAPAKADTGNAKWDSDWTDVPSAEDWSKGFGAANEGDKEQWGFGTPQPAKQEGGGEASWGFASPKSPKSEDDWFN